jgi:hypothetical protein
MQLDNKRAVLVIDAKASSGEYYLHDHEIAPIGKCLRPCIETERLVFPPGLSLF